MHKPALLIAFLALVTGSCTSEGTLTLRNDLAIPREKEPVTISRADFQTRCGTGKPGEVPVLTAGGVPVASQTDDLNGDGQWDELAFVVDIAAQSELTLRVDWVRSADAPLFEAGTQVYLAEALPDGGFREVLSAEAPVGLAGFPSPYQAEGVGWENDRMAFRIYFDCRNIKDLFGKRTPGLILQQAGNGPDGDYHSLAPWGMDILHCGSSLGAGGLALLEGDSLFRLGMTKIYRYAQITEGPVRSIFELNYPEWEVNGQMLSATERITLWLGKQGFRSEVTINGFTGEKQLATGIVTSKLDGEPFHFQANESFTALLTHGRQSLNNDTLAMAILAPANEVTRIGQTTNTDYYKLGYQDVPIKSFSRVISETCYLAQRIQPGVPTVHHFFAFWGLADKAWNDSGNVMEYLRGEAKKLTSPLIIK